MTEEEKCCVCLCDNYKETVTFACKHFVCSECFKDMLKHCYNMCSIDFRCPMCRYLIEPSFIIKKIEEMNLKSIYERTTFTLLNLVDSVENNITDSVLFSILTRKIMLRFFMSIFLFIVFISISTKINTGYSLSKALIDSVKKIIEDMYMVCNSEEDDDCDISNILEYLD